MLISSIKILEQKNTVWHYTSTINAIRYIFFDNVLRLSPRLKSNDPVENYYQQICLKNVINENEITEYALHIHNEYRKKADSVKQLSFCKNEYNDGKIHNIDTYGYLKPRMWDQYGDHYRGVCIGFDQDKLVVNNETHKMGSINYLTYDKFLHMKTFSIESKLTESEYLNEEKYVLDKQFYELFFRKHIDYIGENEFRIISFIDKEYDYIEIKKSITCIILSSLVDSPFDWQIIKDYADKYCVPLYILFWNGCDIDIKSYEEYQVLLKSIGFKRKET